MFRLMGKDLRILGRSRLLVVTLVLYPLLVALLIGLALSRAPEKPKIAVVDQIPRDVPVTTLAGKVVDPAAVADQLVKNLDAVRVPTRAQAEKLVEDGDVLAAIILPDDINDRLSATINLFGGKVIDVSTETVTIEATGSRDKLEALLRVLEPFGVKELVQSGMVAVGRGARSISDRSLRAADRSA